MNAVERVMTLSLASTVSPEAQARRRWEITEFSPPLKKPMALLVHGLTVRKPKRAAKYLGIERTTTNIPHFASGGESMIFRLNGDEVLKVVKKSILLTDAQREYQVSQQYEDHLAMAKHLGQLMLPQTSFIGQHPYLTNRQAVMIRQPYQEGIVDTRLFVRADGSAMSERVSQLQAEQPDAATHLQEFVTGSMALYDDCKLIPDTLGDCNLVTSPAGELLLIDGQPISGVDPKAPEAIGYLEALGSALQAA